MLLLPTETTVEETTLARTHAIPRTIEDQILFKKIWIHVSRHIIINKDGEEDTREPPMGRGHWSPTSVTIDVLSMNFEFETDKAVCHTVSISLEFSTSRALHCRSNKGLSRSEHKQKQIVYLEPFDDFCTWKESRTYGRSSKSGLGAIRI